MINPIDSPLFSDWKASNTLRFSTSPYLLEHAKNPVFWHEWNAETLALAKELDKPLLISIGYAACHWCHVMAEQSFSDKGIAEIMNTHFVCIKIDREERPDLDQIYLNAAQLINGSGGWPLNAFALPDGQPFYAGTYFPKDRWVLLLTQIRNLYASNKLQLMEEADKITQGIRGSEVITLAGDTNEISLSEFEESCVYYHRYFDNINGGTKGAPKFPLPSGWRYLIDYYYYTKDSLTLQMVERTLNAMAAGGIYDQIGGGFARYSVDQKWLVPHFEKMLYDNGQLISLYSTAYKISKNPRYQEVVDETIAFVMRELKHEEGGFYSSLNADSEKEEGKFYVWTKSEILEILDAKLAHIVIDFYNISESGNWEDGKNILHFSKDYEKFAVENGMSLNEFKLVLKQARNQLLEARNKKIRPETDIKIITAWNGLLISALIDAYAAFGETAYLKIAMQNADFFRKSMMNDEGKIMRNFASGKISVDGFLDDYALMAESFMAIYQQCFNIEYFKAAELLVEYAITHFKAKNGALFYYTSDLSESLVARKMEVSDNVIPSSNSVMAKVLYQIGVLSNRADYVELAYKMLSVVKDSIGSGGPYYSNWAALLAWRSHATKEIVITGKGWEQARKEIGKHHLPGVVFAGGMTDNLSLLNNRVNVEKLQIFVCTNKTCALPMESVKDFLQYLNIEETSERI